MSLLLALVAHAQEPSVEAELAAKAAAAALTPAAAAVDWDAANRAIDRSRLRASNIKFGISADTMALPVLLPSDPTLAASASYLRGDGWMVVNLSDADKQIVIHATTAGFVAPADIAAALRRRPSFESTVVDGIRSITFTRYGVYYAIDVECRVPPRTESSGSPCMNDDQARALWNDLETVGGRP